MDLHPNAQANKSSTKPIIFEYSAPFELSVLTADGVKLLKRLSKAFYGVESTLKFFQHQFTKFLADAYTGPDNIGCLILLFILFGLSVTPLMYPATFLFEKPATAYVALTAFNLFIGINTTIAVSVMMAIVESDPDLKNIYDILGFGYEDIFETPMAAP
jgi:hypothetical protein